MVSGPLVVLSLQIISREAGSISSLSRRYEDQFFKTKLCMFWEKAGDRWMRDFRCGHKKLDQRCLQHPSSQSLADPKCPRASRSSQQRVALGHGRLVMISHMAGRLHSWLQLQVCTWRQGQPRVEGIRGLQAKGYLLHDRRRLIKRWASMMPLTACSDLH